MPDTRVRITQEVVNLKSAGFYCYGYKQPSGEEAAMPTCWNEAQLQFRCRKTVYV